MKLKMLLFLILTVSTFRVAAMPNSFTWQGRLSDAGGPANDVFSMIFILHTEATGGDGIAVSTHEQVTVTNGLFTVPLTFPPQHLDGGDRWLGIHIRRVSDSSGPFTELTPRQAITPAPYALMAKSVPDGSITAQKIASGAVGGAQLAPGAVTAASIAPGSLTGGVFAPGSIGGAQLAPGAAMQNLGSDGAGLVPGGGVILSEYANDPRLLTAGYAKLGRTDLVEEEWLPLTSVVSSGFPWPEDSIVSLAGTGQAAVWTGTEWLMFGGQKNYDSYPEFTGIRYNPATNQWTRMNPAEAPSPRRDASAVWTGTEMIVWGGVTYTSSTGQVYFNDGARYNPATDTWTPLPSAGAPSVRASHTAVWTGSEMIVWGGYWADGFYTPLNTGARYNPVTNTWTALTTSGAPSARAWHTAVWTGSVMIVSSGQAIGAATEFPAGGAKYNPATNTWSALPLTNAPAGRSAATAVWTGTEMIVWGGVATDASDNTVYTNTGGRYNPSTNTWTAITTAGAPAARAWHSAVWTGSRLLIWGGAAGSWTYVNTGGNYNPVTNSWTAVTTVNAPTSRRSHVAAWTGSQMLIFGGDAEPGGRYSPVSNTWTPMSVSGDVRERQDYTVIWTGTEMILWGGRSPNGDALQSGFRYDRQSGKWRVTSSTGAPSARFRHTAVWTGDSMILWGGENAGGLLSDGARYSPATDTWQALSTTGTPAARRSHSAVWTGSEMIVWGGRTPTVTSNGGRYHLATGAWQPLETIGAPGARASHKAFWTGAEMIVWGGVNDTNGPMTNGSRFNPVTGTWTFLPAAGGPSPRTDESAVWTGTELIVWGGRHNGASLATGARYNLAANGWSPMAALPPFGTLTARYGHNAVWAGTQMVIWGGFDQAAGVTGGAVYVPQFDDWKDIATGGSVPNDIDTTGTHAAVWSGTDVLLWGGMESGEQSLRVAGYAPARSVYLYMRP